MNNVPTREIVAHNFARRVSRGEYERVFSRLFPSKLRTVCVSVVVDAKGERHVTRYNPIVAVIHPASPKARRKYPNWMTEERGSRARFNHTFD